MTGAIKSKQMCWPENLINCACAYSCTLKERRLVFSGRREPAVFTLEKECHVFVHLQLATEFHFSLTKILVQIK